MSSSPMPRTGAHICLVIACLLMASNLRAADIDIERSHRRAPGWTVRAPEADDTYLYFVGRASNAPSLEAAENDAAADVVRQIVTAIGLEASFNYDRLRSEAGILLDDRIELAGDSRIVGLKRIETYYERRTVTEEPSVKTTWNAHVLARYPLESLENETSRLEQLSAGRVSSAERLLAESSRLESSGFAHRAWEKISEALEMTGSLSVVADPSTSSRMAVVRQKLVQRARSLSTSMRKVTVEEIPQPTFEEFEDGGSISRALETALAAEGFGVERNSEAAACGALPLVRLELSDENTYKIEPGFHFYRWNVAISILAPGGGSVIFGGLYPVKGFGVDETRAALDALRKLRSEVAVKFAAEAREYFDHMQSGEDQTGVARSF